MKKMYVLDLDGNKLFVGARNACKNFIKTNRIKHFKITERYIEKVVKFEAEPENDNHLAKPPTKEGWYNRVFS